MDGVNRRFACKIKSKKDTKKGFAGVAVSYGFYL
jgi:hypothetical protein